MVAVQTSPPEAYRKLDDLSNKHIEVLRKLTKQIQDARINRNNDAIKQSLKEYDESLESYIPVLMAQAKIYWDLVRTTGSGAHSQRAYGHVRMRTGCRADQGRPGQGERRRRG